MSASSKDKRTKDQLLRLLDDALVQEEKLIEQISTLRAQLDDCRKRADDPRAELAEGAIPSSKVPFRLDFYRATGDGPLKGIIEHLPSRQMRTFEGEGQAMIAEFVSQFFPKEKIKVPKTAAQASARTEKNLPHVTGATEPPAPEKNAVDGQGTPRLLLRMQDEFLRQFPELQEQTGASI